PTALVNADRVAPSGLGAAGLVAETPLVNADRVAGIGRDRGEADDDRDGAGGEELGDHVSVSWLCGGAALTNTVLEGCPGTGSEPDIQNRFTRKNLTAVAGSTP